MASLMLSVSVPAYADCGGGNGNDDPPAQGCGPGDNGGNGGGEGGGTNTNTNDNSNTNTNQQGQQQGQAQGQIQGQIATGGDASATGGSVGDTSATGGSVGDTTAVSGSTSSVGDTTATGGAGGEGGDADSTAFGGTAIVNIGGGQGECYEGECEGGSGTLNSNAENNVDVENDNSSSATGGNASIDEGAVTVNIGEDGPLTASSQTVDANATVAEGAVQIDNSNNSVYKESARTAATSFASVCTSGAAAQGNTYGLSLAVTSTQCAYLMQADAYMALGDTENTLKFVDKAARSASIKGFMSNIRSIITLGIL
jgi:hypothetical protein